MASRCRPFTPAPYTPNIRLIWWYTPCLSTTRTVQPSAERPSPPQAKCGAVGKGHARRKAGAHLLGQRRVQHHGVGLGDVAPWSKDLVGKGSVIGQQHKTGAGLVQPSRREQLPPGIGIPHQIDHGGVTLVGGSVTTPSGLLSMMYTNC